MRPNHNQTDLEPNIPLQLIAVGVFLVLIGVLIVRAQSDRYVEKLEAERARREEADELAANTQHQLDQAKARLSERGDGAGE